MSPNTMIKFNIYDAAGAIVDHIHANSADEALNLFAAIVSGYDTFSDMMRSGFFSVKYSGYFAA